MRTKEENMQLSELLFPNVTETVEEVFGRYPKRELKEGASVLRFAPSPTGFLHMGGLYSGFLCTKLSNQTEGVSILRIEDTDKVREVDNGVSIIVDGLKDFGVVFDEGMIDEESENGEYGPYIQSKRLDIYKVFAKDLVSKGYAYPCFLSADELKAIREKQDELHVRTGCYGEWAKWRDASFEDIKCMIDAGKDFVIRLYSTGNFEEIFSMKDLVKGGVTIRQNDMDAVLLKSDGYPTYHFAHPIDDTLMGITNVLRGDEWFASVPLHIELFEKLGFNQIPYTHISPLEKLDDGKKRKLSKRKDPEAAVSYYIEKGYPKKGVLEYLLNIANSSFYDWRIQNPKISWDDFVLKIEKFNKAGALFDIVKLDDVCKNYIATLSASEVYEMALEWSKSFDTELFNLLSGNREYCIKIFDIERTGNKIRKDIVKMEDIREQVSIFFDDMNVEVEDISERVDVQSQKGILEEYLKVFKLNDSSEEWFEDVKALASRLGIEKVGDVAMVLRVSITGRSRTPDLYQVISVLGEDKVRERLEKYLGMMI